MKKLLPILVLLPFTAFSVEVILQHGYFGFVTLAWREPWAMQMLLDLCISLFVAGMWMRRDARETGTPIVPYLVAMPFFGSIGVLGYLVHRAVRAHDPAAAESAAAARRTA